MKSQIQHEIHTVENKQQKLEASPRFGLTDFSCIIHYGEKLLVNNPFLMDSSNLPECRHAACGCFVNEEETFNISISMHDTSF